MALEVGHDRLHRAQLQEHVVAGEDVADVRADLVAERVGTLLPVLLAAVPQVAASLGQVGLDRAALARSGALVRGDPHVLEEQRDRVPQARTITCLPMKRHGTEYIALPKTTWVSVWTMASCQTAGSYRVGGSGSRVACSTA